MPDFLNPCNSVRIAAAHEPQAPAAAWLEGQGIKTALDLKRADSKQRDPDRQLRLEPKEQAELVRIVLAGPDPEADGLSAFTREDLAHICEIRFGKTFHPASLGRMLKRLGFSRQKARPSHPQKDPAPAEAFKKGSGASENHQYSS